MLKIQYPIVISVFGNEATMVHVVKSLKQAGFRNDQLTIVRDGESFMLHNLLSKLSQSGMPQTELQFCEQEFETGHSIVAVRHDGNYWQAITILYEGRVHKYVRRLEGPGTKRQAFSQSETVSQECSPNETSQQDHDIPSWQKLLTDAGFDYLI